MHLSCAGAFAEQVPGIQALAAPVLRNLAQALTQAAVGITESQHLASYIGFIFQGVAGLCTLLHSLMCVWLGLVLI